MHLICFSKFPSSREACLSRVPVVNRREFSLPPFWWLMQTGHEICLLTWGDARLWWAMSIFCRSVRCTICWSLSLNFKINSFKLIPIKRWGIWLEWPFDQLLYIGLWTFVLGLHLFWNIICSLWKWSSFPLKSDRPIIF